MEWDDQIDVRTRRITTRLIIERARARNWGVAAFKTNNAILLLRPPHSKKSIKVFSASPPQTSLAVYKITKDKYITNQILAHEGIKVPGEMLIEVEKPDVTSLEQFLEMYHSVVVKPLDAGHGKGITTHISKLESLCSALQEAAKYTEKKRVAVQQHIEGVDIRMVCIDYKFVNAITRVPASVVGDGVHTVRELINIVNQSEDRGENYKQKLNIISLDHVNRYLSVDVLKSVPQPGETVQVVGVSNTGMGGQRVNITTDIPEELIELAEKISRILDLPVSGVDFLVKKIPSKKDTASDLAPYVIEVNNCPSLFMYDDPAAPEQIKIIDRYLDFIAKY